MRSTRVLFVIAAFILTQPVLAQSDPEAVRVALRGILETQLKTAAMIGSTDAQETIAQALGQLDQLAWEDLAVLEGQTANLQAKQDALYDQLAILEGYIPNLGEMVQQSSQYSSAFLPSGSTGALTGKDYIGLTNANYGAICSVNPFGDPPLGPNRSNADANQVLVTALTVSDEALLVAEGVRDVAGVACNTVVVAAGFGGNPQNLACLVSEAIYIAANVINKGLNVSFRLLTFCDATIDAAEIEGAFERTSDIYDQNVDIDSDLADHDADIKARLDQVIELLQTPQGLRPNFPLRE